MVDKTKLQLEVIEYCKAACILGLLVLPAIITLLVWYSEFFVHEAYNIQDEVGIILTMSNVQNEVLFILAMFIAYFILGLVFVHHLDKKRML